MKTTFARFFLYCTISKVRFSGLLPSENTRDMNIVLICGNKRIKTVNFHNCYEMIFFSYCTVTILTWCTIRTIAIYHYRLFSRATFPHTSVRVGSVSAASTADPPLAAAGGPSPATGGPLRAAYPAYISNKNCLRTC